MELKEKARERMELRIHATETLNAVIAWIQAVQPSQWLPVPAKDAVIGPDELKTQWRDYVDRAGALIGKAWRPAELLVDDLVAFMEEACAKPKSTPQSK
jgi:hypothetical protein